MLRRKPFRLVLADTPSDLYKEIDAQKADSTQYDQPSEEFLTPQKDGGRSSLTVQQRIGFDAVSPPSFATSHEL